MALIACSALAVLSVAAQGLVNVRRDHHLVGPVSLYLLAVADSGERKTTCDGIFSPALRQWESAQLAKIASELASREAAMAAFEAKKAGVLDAIKTRRRRSQDTTREESDLDGLAREAPQPVVVPRLLYTDATPEALAHALATGWPSAGVLSAEAGTVLGGHGMGQETILRYLGLLNVMWEAGDFLVDRRSKPSFYLRHRRLTFGLMVQPDAMRGFMDRAGSLPRGTGFIARFLIAWPATTQGTRRFRAAPAAMPAVEDYRRRTTVLLDTPLPTDTQGGPPAKRARVLCASARRMDTCARPHRAGTGCRRWLRGSARRCREGCQECGASGCALPRAGTWACRHAWVRCAAAPRSASASAARHRRPAGRVAQFSGLCAARGCGDR